MKTTHELSIAATQRDPKGLDAREVPLLPRREKCFLLTSPFIEPGKCDRALVDGLVVRVDQFKGHFVGAGGKTLQDDWVSTGICPHPCGIVESHMNVSDARRDSQSALAEHRRDVQVF